MSNKELTATQFNKDPAQFYRAAYDGETVTISHDHYGQGLFELTYRKRGFKTDKEQLTAKRVYLTDTAKCERILKLTEFGSGANEHLNFHFPQGLPGYVIISENSGPHPVAEKKCFRWTNYEMMNGFADTLEECEQKARDYAAKHEVAK